MAIATATRLPRTGGLVRAGIPGQTRYPWNYPLVRGACGLWLAADRITGLADGDLVGTWLDGSGNLRHATQGTAAAKPVYKVGILNGKPVVRFGGTDDHLVMTDFLNLGTADHTIFLVGTKTTDDGVNPSSGWLEQQSAGGAARYVIWQAKTTLLLSYYHNGAVGAGFAGDIGSFRVRSFRRNGTTSEHWLNGGVAQSAVIADADTTGGGGIYIGRMGVTLTAYLIGDMAEIILYPYALSESERLDIEKYLSWKYAIPTVP